MFAVLFVFVVSDIVGLIVVYCRCLVTAVFVGGYVWFVDCLCVSL